MTGFAQTEAKKLPKLGCIGKVSAVGEVTETESGNYLKVPIQIEGIGASRSLKVFFLYRPEWLTENFRIANFSEIEGGDKMEFVYSQNISQDGVISVLQGLAGGKPEDLTALAGKIFALPINTETGGPSNEDVGALLQTELITDATLGYVLKQQRQKTGTDEETGKAVYTNTPFYEVDRYFVANDKGIARLTAQAAKAQRGTFFVQFTAEDVPV